MLPLGQLPANEILPQDWTVFFWHVPLSCPTIVSRTPITEEGEKLMSAYVAVVAFTTNRSYAEILLGSRYRQCNDSCSSNSK